MEQLLPLSTIETPVTVKLHVLTPSTPKAAEVSAPAKSPTGGPQLEQLEHCAKEPSRKRQRHAAGETCAHRPQRPRGVARCEGTGRRKSLQGAPERLAGAAAAAAPPAAAAATPPTPTAAAAAAAEALEHHQPEAAEAESEENVQPEDSVSGSEHLSAAAGDSAALENGRSRNGRSSGAASPTDSPAISLQLDSGCQGQHYAVPLSSLRRALFLCLRDLRSANGGNSPAAPGGAGASGGAPGISGGAPGALGGAPGALGGAAGASGGAPGASGASGGAPGAPGEAAAPAAPASAPVRFSSHVLNVIEANDAADLSPYVEIFSVCLNLGVSPRCLSPEAQQLMVDCLAALDAAGYSVHARRIFSEYHRVLKTLRRRDLLLAPLWGGSGSSSSKGACASSLSQALAKLGPEDARLADLWVAAYLDDPAREGGPLGRPSSSSSSSSFSTGRPHEYLLHCKGIILMQLRSLRRLAPVWASRDRAYQYHLEAVLRAQRPTELMPYLAVLSSLEADPEGRYPVSAASLLECLRELHIPQRMDLQEGLTGPLPVTQGELLQCLAAAHSRRTAEQAGGGPLGPTGRKYAARAVSSLPTLSTRGQRHKLVSAQLEAEITLNLQRVASRASEGLFSSAADPRERLAEAVGDPSLLYAGELLEVAEGDNGSPQTAAQQCAFIELQRLSQYWAEGMFPDACGDEGTAAAAAAAHPTGLSSPPSPPHSVVSAPGRAPAPCRLTRTRSTPCPFPAAAEAPSGPDPLQPLFTPPLGGKAGEACTKQTG